MSTEVFEY